MTEQERKTLEESMRNPADWRAETFAHAKERLHAIDRCRDMEEEEIFERIKIHLQHAYEEGVGAYERLHSLRYAERYVAELCLRALNWVAQVEWREEEEARKKEEGAPS